MRPLIVSRCKVTKSKFGNVRICPNLSVFVGICRFSERCFFSLQSYEKENWHCQSMSVYVTLCHFPIHSLFLDAKLQKVNLALSPFVSFCHYLSPFVTFCHLSANCFFTMQSYEKKSWHCPHLSAYVRKCPHLSVFDIAMSRIVVAKLRKSILALSP